MSFILPSLFDRLTGNSPVSEWEVAGALEHSVKRDLEVLLNSRTLESSEDISLYPEVAKSVTNYGIQEYAGLVRNDLNIREVTDMIRYAILTFEPRISPKTLEVISNCELEDSQKKFSELPKEVKQKIFSKGAFEFTIRGSICATEAPIDFHTKLALNTGKISID